jgi:hypothetical protein
MPHSGAKPKDRPRETKQLHEPVQNSGGFITGSSQPFTPFHRNVIGNSKRVLLRAPDETVKCHRQVFPLIQSRPLLRKRCNANTGI